MRRLACTKHLADLARVLLSVPTIPTALRLSMRAARDEQDGPRMLEVYAHSGVMYGGAMARDVRLATTLSSGKDYSIWDPAYVG
jgi:hypothetical protein